MTSTSKQTLEPLMEVLKQTLTEKQQIERKFAEDMQRLNREIADIQSTVAGLIEELQEVNGTIQVQQLQCGAVLPSASDQVPVLKTRVPIAPPVKSQWMLSEKTLYRIITAVLLFVLIFYAMSKIDIPKSGRRTENVRPSAVLTLPSLMSSADACVLSDRIQERRQARMVESDLSQAMPVSDDLDELEVSADQVAVKAKSKVLRFPLLRRLFRSNL